MPLTAISIGKARRWYWGRYEVYVRHETSINVHLAVENGASAVLCQNIGNGTGDVALGGGVKLWRARVAERRRRPAAASPCR